jgi:ectoine hydroxylase
VIDANPPAMLMFRGNMKHDSPPNMTPYPRKIVYLMLCAGRCHINRHPASF